MSNLCHFASLYGELLNDLFLPTGHWSDFIQKKKTLSEEGIAFQNPALEWNNLLHLK